MEIQLAIFAGALLAVAVTAALVYKARQREFMEVDETIGDCLVCDGPVALHSGGAYECGSCGFSPQAVPRDRAAEIERYRDLKMGLSELSAAQAAMTQAAGAAHSDLTWGIGAAKYRHFGTANEHWAEGMRLIRDVVSSTPELKSRLMATRTIADSSTRRFFDLIGDNRILDLRVLNEIERAEETMAEFVDALEVLRRELGGRLTAGN